MVSVRDGFASFGFGWKHGHHLGEGRVVRVVAIDAGVAGAATTGEIPVALHAAVAAIPVITELRSVALGAESHAGAEVDRLTVCQFEGVVIRGVVATQTAQLTVGVGEALVKLVEFGGGVDRWFGRARVVTGRAGHHHRLAVGVATTAVDHHLSVRLADHDGMRAARSRARCGSLGEGVAALSSGTVDLDGLITRRFRLDDAGAALRAASDPASIAIVVDADR